ncbi:MAG: LCP family protein [Patescibacteria group bacterium]
MFILSYNSLIIIDFSRNINLMEKGRKTSIKRKIMVKLVQAAAIFVIITLPFMSAIFCGFIILKTYNVSKIIVKEDYLGKTENQTPGNNRSDIKVKARELVMQTKQLAGVEKPSLKWGSEDRVNVLLLGKASEDYPGSNLTDTVILASFNPKTNKAAMLSIPRDLYTRIPNTNKYTKLNAIYHYGFLEEGEKTGIRYISDAIKEITGQEVDYFVMLDFKGFVKLVDQIGGVRINVERELIDTRYPGPNYSYQTFHIDKGWQELDGETALKYVRTRHNAGGDFGRAGRQQQVLGAIKNKFFSVQGISLIVKLNAILDIISQNVVTDIDFSEYGSFVALARNINEHNVINKVLDNRGEDPILTNFSPRLGARTAYFLKPAEKDYSQIHEIAQNIFNLEKLRKTHEKRVEEKPYILLVNRSGNRSAAGVVKKRLTEAGFSRVKEQTAGAETVPDEIFERSVVCDFTSGLKPYSLDSLADILDAGVELIDKPESLEDENFDLMVVLGNNVDEFLKQDEIVLPEEAFMQEEY